MGNPYRNNLKNRFLTAPSSNPIPYSSIHFGISKKFTRRYKLTIAYDGSPYSGWQVQNNAPSIQPLVQQALIIALRHKLEVTGSGRTDAGVHACGQVAHFDTSIPFEPKKLLLSLNALLPKTIRILSIDSVWTDFHARYSAVKKTYHYHLHLDPIADPFLAPYRYHVLGTVNRAVLGSATRLFVGTRDFTSFANEAGRGSASRGGVRTLFRFDAIEQSGGLRLELEADGFLYKMVRNLVGTLVDVAKGKQTPAQVEAIFAAKDRRKAGAAAPPQGLFLMQVDYSAPIQSEGICSNDSKCVVPLDAISNRG